MLAIDGIFEDKAKIEVIIKIIVDRVFDRLLLMVETKEDLRLR